MDKEPDENGVLVEGVHYFLSDEENSYQLAARLAKEQREVQQPAKNGGSAGSAHRSRVHPLDSTMFENKRGIVRARQGR